MKISFSKYQGTGNDFVMLDNLNGQYNTLSIEMIQKICARHFGVGADGLIKINTSSLADFEVDYYNSDGSKSFCGNGARCSVAFAETLGVNIENASFIAIDGLHKAVKKEGVIALEMNDVSEIQVRGDDFIIHTGSPHYIKFTSDISLFDIVAYGKEIRYSQEFIKEGINVNLVEVINTNQLVVSTYERGVENETLSCGTGVTASVLAYAYQEKKLGDHSVDVKVKGGELKVSFTQVSQGVFNNIQLIGPGEFVYRGEMDV